MNTLNRSCLYILCLTVLYGSGATTAQAAPPNDNFDAATTLTGETGTTTGNNILAITEPGEPDYIVAATPACSSVWYQWTAPSTGEYFFNTFGSDFDTILAVYTGSAVDALTWVNDNDDYQTPTYTQSRLSFTVAAEDVNTVYKIAVDGFSCAQGYLALNWGPSSLLPANDNLTSATGISGSTGASTGTNINATAEAGEFTHHTNNSSPYSSIWFAWTAPLGGGQFIFDTFGSNFDTVMSVYTGTGFFDLNQLASSDDVGEETQSRVAFPANSSEVYLIAIDGFEGLQGNVSLQWEMLPELAPNDNFGSATELNGKTGTVNAHNFLTITEAGEPPHGDAAGPHASIWFTWTAPFSGNVVFDTFGSDFDTTMAAYTGTAVDSLTKLEENDDAGSNTQSRITFPVVSGSTYYIAVDGFESEHGNVILNWRQKSPWTLFIPAVTRGSRP